MAIKIMAAQLFLLAVSEEEFDRMNAMTREAVVVLVAEHLHALAYPVLVHALVLAGVAAPSCSIN